MYKLIAMNKQIDIKELIDWYIMAGVVETCGDEPCLLIEENNIAQQVNLQINKKAVITNTSKPDNLVSLALKMQKKNAKKHKLLVNLRIF